LAGVACQSCPGTHCRFRTLDLLEVCLWFQRDPPDKQEREKRCSPAERLTPIAKPARERGRQQQAGQPQARVAIAIARDPVEQL
jgi:hypothetical protein